MRKPVLSIWGPRHLGLQTLAAALLLIFSALPARADAVALIALQVGAEPDWERVLLVQELLERRHSFDKIEVMTDATTQEVYDRTRDFLEAPASPGDRRFVWISGLSVGEGETMCPDGEAAPLKPKAMSLVLAPECLGRLIDLPTDAIHISRGRMSPAQLSERLRFARRGADEAGAPIAVIALPSSDQNTMRIGDEAVIDALKGSRGVVLHPLGVLDALRARFRPGPEQTFAPGLDVAAWHARFVEPGGRGEVAGRSRAGRPSAPEARETLR